MAAATRYAEKRNAMPIEAASWGEQREPSPNENRNVQGGGIS
jgi:hypothetical protein